MQPSEELEETVAAGRWRGWLIVLIICAVIAGWGLVNYFLVGSVPRAWDFCVLPDAPGESIYSTGETQAAPAPARQIPPLPEAQPKKQTGGGQ